MLPSLKRMTAHSVPETPCTGSHITSVFIFPSDSTTGQTASFCCTPLVQLHQPGAEDSRGHDLDNQEVGAHAPATACPERRLTMTRRSSDLVLLGLLVLPAAALAAPEGKIVIAQGVDPTTLDPQWHEETPAYNVLLNIYDTLLFRDKDLKIIPWLAESWKLVNPTTWEFKIRKGVKFHNGEEVDADAVKFSLDRIRDPETKARQSVYFRLVTSVDVVDKHTVRVVTSRPYPTLENHLALRGAIMPPGHFRGKDKVFADRNPVGSGPYKFVRWVKDEQIELEANPSWWGGAPKIKTIVFRPIPEHAVRAAALQAGEIDVAVNIPPHLVQSIEKHPRLYVSKAPSVRTIFIPIYAYQYDTANKPVGPVEGPTRDKRVRQALLAAVNVDEIIKTVLEGNAVRTATPLTPKHFGFDPSFAPVKLDVDRVRKLLAEAGFPQGLDLTLNSPDGRYQKDKEVAEAVAGQLTKAGIRTRVKRSEEHTSELQSPCNLVCRLLLEKKKKINEARPIDPPRQN